MKMNMAMSMNMNMNQQTNMLSRRRKQSVCVGPGNTFRSSIHSSTRSTPLFSSLDLGIGSAAVGKNGKASSKGYQRHETSSRGPSHRRCPP